jgi:hypothetical protein
LEWPVRVARLASNPQENGLWCGPEGVTLAGRPLLEETKTGLAPRSLPVLQRILDETYGEEFQQDAQGYIAKLASVARSLNKGDLPLAMIGSVMLGLPEVPTSTPLPIQVIDPASKFDPAQARDHNGRWTEGSADEARQTQPIGFDTDKSPPFIDLEAEAAGSTEVESLTALAPRVIGLLGGFAEIIAAPVALTAGLLIPTNGSNVHSGDIPGFPGLTYRSDEGIVTLSRLDATGNIEHLYRGFPDPDGFYHDDEGYIIGRQVGTAVLFDSDALAEITTKTANPPDIEADPSQTPNSAPTPATEDDEPRVCPAPTPENIAGRSKRTLAYQTQMTGLPPGLDVEYRSVRFDGCDEDTGRMIEAKGLGMEWMLNWPYDKLVKSKFYQNMMKQADRQDKASRGRGDDYYFADVRMANFFDAEFEQAGYTNIKVHHIEAIVKKIEDCVAWIRRSLEISWLARRDGSQSNPLEHMGVRR